MSLRAIALAAALGLAPLTAPVVLSPAFAQAETAAMSMEELMRATALDDVFTQFAPSVATAPEEQGMPFVGGQKTVWLESVHQVFRADRMHAELARALRDQFDPEDLAVFTEFYRSDFGIMISEIERAVTTMTPEQQTVMREEGIALAAAGDPRRQEQIDEMLKLVSADIATAIVRQSVRGMLIGMTMNGQQGDIEVPWEEIDAHLDTIMPAVEADVQLTQRAMMFYSYAPLSESDLDRYLDFLRTTAAQKLYAIASYAIGEIITTHMEEFGETLARRLAQVSV
jgi:hypothetical protein